MSNIKRSEIEKEYITNKTSWKFFDRKLKEAENKYAFSYQNQLLLEILKELQYLNHKII